MRTTYLAGLLICGLALAFPNDTKDGGGSPLSPQPDCIKAWNDAAICEAQVDRNTQCINQAENAHCEPCTAGTMEPGKKDPNADGCCCVW